MNNGVSPFHQRIMNYITDYRERKGYSPSVRDICKKTGRALGTIQYHLDMMEGEGLIARDTRIPRSIRVVK